MHKTRRVMLIYPPLYRDPLWDPIRISQPLGIWSIGSYLKTRGHEVQLLCADMQGATNQRMLRSDRSASDVDYRAYYHQKVQDFASGMAADKFLDKYEQGLLIRVGLENAQILREVEDFGPDVIGISATVSCLHDSVIDLARHLRDNMGREVPIVVGGQHASALPKTMLKDANGSIDYVVLGEGEKTFCQLIEALDSDSAAQAVPGIAYHDRRTRECMETPRPEFIDLNSLPPLDPELIQGLGFEGEPTYTYSTAGRRYTEILFSLGCHNNCAFCCARWMRGHLRLLSEDNIRHQLRILRDAGYEELVLQDDDLLHDKPAFRQLLSLIKEYGFSWQDNGGLGIEDLNGTDVTHIIRHGNCKSLYIPLNPRRLRDAQPDFRKLDKKRRLLQRLKDAGIYVFTSGIYGVPNLDCPDTFMDDISRLREYHVSLVSDGRVDASLVFPLSVLPGTRWWTEGKAGRMDFVDEDWLAYSIYVPQVRPRGGSMHAYKAALLETHRELNAHQTSYPWFSPFPTPEVALGSVLFNK